MIVASPLSKTIVPSSVSTVGSMMEIVATEAERLAITATFDLLELRSFSCRFELQRSGDTITMEGRVRSDLAQACVVSLAPVNETIDATFERKFVRQVERSAPGDHVEDVDLVESDPPDSYTDTIDLAAVALEEFALALDPYPRAPGVEFKPVEDEDDEADSPFAVLRSLGKADPT